MTRLTRHLNDWPTWIKENCVQHLFRTYGSLGNTWAFFFLSFRFHCLSSALLCGSNMCTKISSPVSKLAFVCFQKYPGTFKAFSFAPLLLSEQMRYPPSANLSQVQTLFQNCLHTAFWNASTTSYIFERQSRILFYHNLYSSDVSLGNRSLGLPGRISSSTENFPALKL